MLTVGLVLASFFLLFGMARIALVDIGLSLEEVGILVGVTAPLISLPVFPIVGLGVKHFGRGSVLTTFRIMAVVVGLLWVIASAQNWLYLAIIASVTGTFVLGGIYVFILSAILSWADGEHPATSYALALWRRQPGGTVPTARAGLLASTVGWPLYYFIAIAFFILATENFRKRSAGLQNMVTPEKIELSFDGEGDA